MTKIKNSSAEEALSSAKKTNQKIEVSNRFLLNSLRSIGYDSLTAIAELVDNAIDAGSKEIRIYYNAKLKQLIISDNGSGMSLRTLKEAMNLGSEREYVTSDIGNFGSGMKLSCLNLVDIENINHLITIKTSNGKESSLMGWSPINTGFDCLCDKTEPLGYKGTRITIDGIQTVNVANLKRHLGMWYFHVLKHGNVKVFVGNDVDSEVEIVPSDPLYRDQVKQKNTLTAKVDGHDIDILAVQLDNTLGKNSWDNEAKLHGDGKWATDKGGIYVLYGGRYIEYGGMLNSKPFDPWNINTRLEFTIPKELTGLFGIKVNKTQGLNLSEKKCPPADDLRRKIRDAFNWGVKLRGKAKGKEVTEEEKDSTDKVLKALNEAARKAKFLKPVMEDDMPSQSKEPVESPSPDENESPKDEAKDKRSSITPKIRQYDLFDLRFEDLHSAGVFWHLGYKNKKFTIIMNSSHVFYTEIYSKVSDEVKLDFTLVLGSLALSQYETNLKDNINSTNTDMFWAQYWSTVSMKLLQLIAS